MITKHALEQMRAARPITNAELTYTIGGTVEAQVRSTVEIERLARIQAGDICLQQALHKLRHDQAKAFNHGIAKQHFNKSTQEI